MIEEPYVYQIFTGKKQMINDSFEPKVYKIKVEERIWLGENGFLGDEESNEDKALYVYPIKHYKFLKKILKQDNMDYGVIGENLSVLEMDEYSVCVGDTYQFGEALIQVSQPHLPNWEVSRRFKKDDLALILQNKGFTGWYFRVLQGGNVSPQTDLKLIDRPHPMWTIAACNEVMHTNTDDLRLIDELSCCNALSLNWQKLLQARMRGQTVSSDKRLFGPEGK